jgi:hypothetical protein
MKNIDFQQDILHRAGVCLLLIGSVALAGNSEAATAVGTASATVLESVSVTITVPPPGPPVVVTTPTLSGTTFTIESFTASQSTSGPLLRVVSPPPPVSSATGTEGGAGSQGGAGTQGAGTTQSGTGGGSAPPAANTATVNVTRKADGSLSVSGGGGMTIAVSQSVTGAVNIEYN